MKLKRIKEIMESFGKKMDWDENTSFPCVLNDISKVWKTLDEDKQRLLAKSVLGDEIIDKKYVGNDLKWLLYTYVVDFEEKYNTNNLTFICGKFAYSKLHNLNGFQDETDYGLLDLNGESVDVCCDGNMDKKKIILYDGFLNEKCGTFLSQIDKNKNMTVFYFA